MILWTIRHTKPLNINQVCYGRTDFDVSPSFETEYPPALEALKTAKINRLFSSPLLRCKRLAEKVSEHLSIPFEINEDIIELFFGHWENVRLVDVPSHEMDSWKADLRGYRFPGNGESFRDVDVRVSKAIESSMDMGEIAWVTHAGVIASLQHTFCGVPENDFIEGKFGYSMVTRFEFEADKNGRIQGRFDTIHQGLPQPPLGVG